MKRILKLFLGLIVLLILAAIIVPFVVPADKIKAEVLAQIEARTGRKVTVEKVSISIFPTLSLNAQNATIGNPDWAPGNMAEVKTLKVGLELMPLLHGDYRLKELTLEQPVIVLIKQQGRANWEMGKTVPATTTAPQQVHETAPHHMTIPDLHLYKIAITDGTITYKDGNKAQTIPNINLTLKAPDFSSKADLDFSAVYQGKKLNTSLLLTKPLGLADGDETGVKMKASYGAIDFMWEGTAKLPRNGVPTLTGKITMDALDTTQLGAKEGEPASSSARSETPASHGGGRWSDAPIAFDGLARANANMTISIGKLTLPKTTLENINAAIRLSNGDFQLTVQPFQAYGGTLDISATATSAGAITLGFSAQGAQAEPLLHDFAGFDRLAGTLNTQAHINASGRSQRALVDSLGGSGKVEFKDGKLKGVNIPGMLRNLSGQQSESQSTDFSELSASYTISHGVVTTNDVKMNSPLLRLTGAGSINLPGWQEHMLLKPMLVASLEGQGGKNVSGIVIPIAVDGPLDHPAYKPDMATAIQDNLETLKDPSKLKDNVKALKQQLLPGGKLNGDALKGLLR